MASIARDPFTSDRDHPAAPNVRLRSCPACKNDIAAENFECPRCGCTLRWFWVRRVTIWGALVAAGTWLLNHFALLRIF
jgi:hypothetical protein